MHIGQPERSEWRQQGHAQQHINVWTHTIVAVTVVQQREIHDLAALQTLAVVVETVREKATLISHNLTTNFVEAMHNVRQRLCDKNHRYEKSYATLSNIALLDSQAGPTWRTAACQMLGLPVSPGAMHKWQALSGYKAQETQRTKSIAAKRLEAAQAAQRSKFDRSLNKGAAEYWRTHQAATTGAGAPITAYKRGEGYRSATRSKRSRTGQ